MPCSSETKFKKVEIDTGHKCEAVGIADVNGDGVLDIVCGTHWFEGPHWKKHKLREIAYEHEYFDDFGDLPMDVNGNGRPDIISGGWFCKSLSWYENPLAPGLSPAQAGDWKGHLIDECGNVETVRLWDVDGDGFPDVVPNCPNSPVVWYSLDRDADGKGKGTFTKHVISETPPKHGLGFGDVNGDGRDDIIVSGGWYEAPEDRRNGKWKFHPDWDLGSASVPVIVHDVNGDGLPDLIWGMAHDYGLFWLEQKPGPDGSLEWIKHEVTTSWSQAHVLVLADLDGDGEMELVTGKRYRAHNGKDPGGNDPCVLYYYKMDRDSGVFTPHVIDEGNKVGVGIDTIVQDINGDGRPDIICPGKGGLYLFLNEGAKA